MILLTHNVILIRARRRIMPKLALSAALAVTFALCACADQQPLSLSTSKSDRTTKSWGDDTDYGKRTHYVHVIRDENGKIKEIYRYYLDVNRKPVLDGIREIRRWEHDPGLIMEYRDGHFVRKYQAIITG
jgi:hypothetical protein